MSSADKATIRGCLEMMQGARCAYCEASVDDMGYHIEHFRRKRDFPQLTFEWSNLLMCCGKDDCCGHFKDRGGSPYDVADLIDPTIEEPDLFFWFRESGVVDVRRGCTGCRFSKAENDPIRPFP
ncbi:TIGR02646 family protein [Leptolyngbya sp. 15MV]|nr:TIGR02646 family protein [Leptolyngbya sp. 15MV]